MSATCFGVGIVAGLGTTGLTWATVRPSFVGSFSVGVVVGAIAFFVCVWQSGGGGVSRHRHRGS
jgi:hypothetical protein